MQAAPVSFTRAPLSAREAILALLYCPVEQHVAAPVDGRTRLVKELFLITQEEEVGKSMFSFRFTPGLYGPSSLDVTNTLGSMIRLGEVRSTPNLEGKSMVIRLYGKAGQEAGQLWNSLPKEWQIAFQRIKAKYANYQYKPLLKHVYKNFPDYATNSLIRDEILGDE